MFHTCQSDLYKNNSSANVLHATQIMSHHRGHNKKKTLLSVLLHIFYMRNFILTLGIEIIKLSCSSCTIISKISVTDFHLLTLF